MSVQLAITALTYCPIFPFFHVVYSCLMFQLYGEFADVFDLSESKLAIIHCAGHYDPTLVESMWRDIIEKGNLVWHN